MAERPEPHEDPALAIAARHALHDEELIAAFAVDGDAADDATRAKALIERCVACRDLHSDLATIGTTLRASGPAEAVGAVRPAPRDFRLSVLDAARLRPRGRRDRVIVAVFGGIATFGRPVGATLATFGLVGLLVGTVGLGPLGASPAAAPGDAFSTGAPVSPGDGPGASAAGGYGPSPTDEGRTGAEVYPFATGTRDTSEPNATATEEGRPGSSVIALLFGSSIAVLVLGLALLFAGSRLRRRSSSGLRT